MNAIQLKDKEKTVILNHAPLSKLPRTKVKWINFDNICQKSWLSILLLLPVAMVYQY